MKDDLERWGSAESHALYPDDVQRLDRSRLEWRRDGTIEVGVDPSGDRAYYGDQFSLPRQYAIRTDDPSYPLIVELEVQVTDQGIECFAIECIRRRGGRAVSLDALRGITVWEIIERSLPLAGQRIGFRAEDSEGSSFAITERDVRKDERDALTASVQETTRQPLRRGRPVDDRRLREAAAIYVEALPSRKPTAAVMSHFGVSRRTAVRYVELAEKRGFLDVPRIEAPTKKATTEGGGNGR